MNKNLLFVILAVAGWFCIIILLNLICNKSEIPEVTTIIDTVTITVVSDSLIYDTIIYSDIKVINDTIYLNNTIIQKDTVFVYLNDYLAKKFFCDTILSDTSGLIIISDTIFKNNIYTRKSDIMLYNITKTIQDNSKHFYFGAGTSINQDVTFNANFYYQNKKNLYGIGINTEKQILFNYIYRIK